MKKKLILFCQFSVEEINGMAQEIAHFLSSKTKVEADKKETVKKFNQGINFILVKA